MARKIYFDRYLENPRLYSTIIFIKGLKIISIYILYVFFMRIFTNTDISQNIMSFLFEHRFFTVVLFTFGILYMLTPFFLFLFTHYKKLLILMVLMLTFLVIAYDSHWSIPASFKKLMLDRQLFLYPLSSSVVVYATGFAISHIEMNLKKDVHSPRITLFVLAVICIHLLLISKLKSYADIVCNRQYFTLIESITPYLAIIVVRYLITMNSIYKYLSTSSVLCVGILSLHFYVISNLFLGLLSLSNESAPGIKFLGLIGVFLLSYMFTFWRYGSIYEINSKTRRHLTLRELSAGLKG
jgi:hypothetical protein